MTDPSLFDPFSAKAEKAESALRRAEMLRSVAQAAIAAKGFYDCYEEHCAKCLENCEE
jgi:hypothetical protein